MMNNINQKAANIWCDRLRDLMKRDKYTQETFLKAFKEKYHRGTQTNISRWLRVGNTITKKNGETALIGFPSYENMKRIADFFGVSVGYLTGETDFETFELEKACGVLGIDELTGKTIRGISSGELMGDFETYNSNQYQTILKCLITTESFLKFVKALQEWIDVLYCQQHPIKHMDSAIKEMNPNIVDFALQCLDYISSYDEKYGEVDDFKDNDVKPTEELLEAIRILNEARENDFFQPGELELRVKIAKYELQEAYFRIIEELEDNHLGELFETAAPFITSEELEVMLKPYKKTVPQK